MVILKHHILFISTFFNNVEPTIFANLDYTNYDQLDNHSIKAVEAVWDLQSSNDCVYMICSMFTQ